MYAISTSDYAIYKGYRCHSPCATDEERLMFEKNQNNKRRLIEIELHKIPLIEQTNLSILMKCMYSEYVEQNIEIYIVKNDNVYETLNKLNKNTQIYSKDKFELYFPNSDITAYPLVWKNFDITPFKDLNTTNLNNQISQSKIYLSVPYNEKDDAKKLNAKWDYNIKKWYILNDNLNKELILHRWKLNK